MTSVETTKKALAADKKSQNCYSDNEIISKVYEYAILFRESYEASRLANEAEFNHRICDSKAHSLHMNAAVLHFNSENFGEMGFQTTCDENKEVNWKKAEKDAEWAKLQVGVAEAEFKRLSLEAERVKSIFEEKEEEILGFFRGLQIPE